MLKKSYIIILVVSCVSCTSIQKPSDKQAYQLGAPALKGLCDSLAKDNALTQVVITKLNSVGKAKTIVSIDDKNELEIIQQSMFSATRKVFVFHQGAVAGEPPSYKIEIFIENQKISIWLFSLGFSSCRFAESGKMFYCKKLANTISNILRKCKAKSFHHMLLMEVKKWP